jgi:hypothetical protein
MLRQGLYAVVVLLVLTALSLGADSHRVVVLDTGGHSGADKQRLLLIEIESGRVLADAELGVLTNLAVSGDENMVAALTTVVQVGRPQTKLNFYRTANLSLVQTGGLSTPVHGPGRSKAGFAANIHFSPDNSEIVFCGLVPREPGSVGNVDTATTGIVRVKRERDGENFYRPIVAATIGPCRSVDFVSLNQWPKVIALNQTTSELLTIDLDRGDIVHSLTVAEPARVSFMPMRLRGLCLSDDGRNAYFLPRKSGLLKKIDMSGEPQVATARGADESNLRQNVAAVSERAGRIFILDDRRTPMSAYDPTRWIKVFSAADLRFQQEIELPLADCHALATSHDGKYLYAIGPLDGPPFAELSITRSRLAVIDAASGRELKILEAGQRPALVFPVAEQ